MSQVFRLHLNEANPHTLADLLEGIAARLRTVDTTQPFSRQDYRDAHKGWLGHYQTAWSKDGENIGRYAVKPSDDR